MLNFSVEEHFLHSKTSRPEDCEDFIYKSDNFIAVIDGATSKTNAKWDGDSPGRIAGKLIMNSLDYLPANATAQEAVNVMTEKVYDFYRTRHLLDQLRDDPALKVTASFVALSLARKEIWLVGDCQALTSNKLIRVNKKIDILLSEIRAIYLETELLKGKTIEQLLINDTGREYIRPILRRQQLFQNDPSYAYWYPAIDGFPVPDEGIIVESVPTNTSFVILASDGYLELGRTLTDTETALQTILRDDPLLFRLYKSTKGKLTGQASFDDRAFIYISIGQ